MEHCASGQSSAGDVAGPPRLTPAAVERAADFIHSNAARKITVADIAAAAGISVRGLQHAFGRHVSSTPLAYLQRVRLDHAHQDLQAADPTAGGSVAAIAARWQFVHPSRFAALYRRAYGQPPSHTLRTRPEACGAVSVSDPVAGRSPAGYGDQLRSSPQRRVTVRRARADERDRIADERDRAADERDRIADERDRVADERDKRADAREELADQRERRLDALEERLRERQQRLGAQADELITESRAAIQRSKDAADRSLARLDRSDALIAAEDVRAEREQAEIDHETDASWRILEE